MNPTIRTRAFNPGHGQVNRYLTREANTVRVYTDGGKNFNLADTIVFSTVRAAKQFMGSPKF